jgi:glucosamine-6-phosphate deaminase
MAFSVIVTRDFDQMSEVAAGLVAEDIRRGLARGPSYVLGLATGISPTGLYKHLAKAANAGAFDASRITSFNLDEYVGLPGENAQQRALHKEAYGYFMVQELFGLLRKKFLETNVPWGALIDQGRLEAEMKENPGDWTLQGEDAGKAIVIGRDARSDYLRWIRRDILDAYAEKIARRGGIDLHIVGIGRRGHVGFHEAGIPFEDNEMLLVKLDESTIANAVADGHFPSRMESPSYAVSMGAPLIYRAATVLIVATGKRKARAVADALLMDPAPSVPVSYSHLAAERGGRVVFVLDREAAADVMPQADRIRGRGIELEEIGAGGASTRVSDLSFRRCPETGLMG